MSDELTREQAVPRWKALGLYVECASKSGDGPSRIIIDRPGVYVDAAFYEAQLAAMTQERDGQAMQIDALRTHLSATIAERDRLKEALKALDRMTNIHKIQDLDAHAVIHKALRGTQEP